MVENGFFSTWLQSRLNRLEWMYSNMSHHMHIMRVTHNLTSSESQ